MKTIQSDKIVCFDVDDTLISQDIKILAKSKKKTIIICGEYATQVSVIEENVKALKRHKNQGQTVIVWSAAGYRWAEAVVKSLKLTQYVDFVMSKPSWYYDDIPCEKWMGNPRWGGDRR